MCEGNSHIEHLESHYKAPVTSILIPLSGPLMSKKKVDTMGALP